MLDFTDVTALRQALFGHLQPSPELLRVIEEVKYLAALKAAR